MKLNYNVRFNDVFYPHGTEVPIESEDALFGNTAPKKVEPVVVKPGEEEVIEPKKKLTKTDINRMSTKELRELAKANGINSDDFVGSELKEMLIAKLV